MSKWDELNPMQRLAVKQALYKVLAEDVSTKDPDNLRGQVDAQLREMYEMTGSKSYDVRLEGQKVGTMAVTVSKEVPERAERRFEVTDRTALAKWFPQESPELIDKWVDGHWAEFAEWYFGETGEMPDGCELVETRVPAQPPRAKGTTLRIDPDKVAEALGSALPTAIAGLLGGGGR